MPASLTPPPIPPNHPNRLPLAETEKAVPKKQESLESDWTIIEKPEKPNVPLPTSPTGGPQQSHGGRKWKKPRWAKKSQYGQYKNTCICMTELFFSSS